MPSSELEKPVSETPLILFVCVHNAGRSRMAEAFFSFLVGERYRVASAGTEPAQRAHPEVIAAMKERVITLQDGPGRLLTNELVGEAERVIGMGCNVQEACPAVRIPLEDWELDDPKGKDHAKVAAIRDQIGERVRALIAELDGKTV